MNLEQIKAIAAKRTSRPFPTYFGRSDISDRRAFAIGPIVISNDDQAQADQDFIVMADTHIDALIKIVDRAELSIPEMICTCSDILCARCNLFEALATLEESK